VCTFGWGACVEVRLALWGAGVELGVELGVRKDAEIDTVEGVGWVWVYVLCVDIYSSCINA